uniref:MULE transposase domain-containing protein n=1 Tax=Plectus sambesii TaxID=2011161 RepID=A0A914W686_9BILA
MAFLTLRQKGLLNIIQFNAELITGELGIYTLPCLFALMPNRQTTTYRRLLALRYYADLNPATCMTDFEEAAINAFREAWPDIQMFGCFYHLAQNQQKKLAQSTYRNENLAIVVSEDLALHQQVKMLHAMAFVPLADPDEVWDSLIETMDHYLRPLFEYFDKYYLGKQLTGGGRRDVAKFPLELCNMYQ